MTGYFIQAGVPVANEHHPPAGPAELGETAARWGIEFWSGPVDTTPVA